jgi:hypothetical protein
MFIFYVKLKLLCGTVTHIEQTQLKQAHGINCQKALFGAHTPTRKVGLTPNDLKTDCKQLSLMSNTNYLVTKMKRRCFVEELG